jgi:hypothetical protein
MSEPASEERERSFRRVRGYYSEYEEWERLERPEDGALEFMVNKAWLTRPLPSAEDRLATIDPRQPHLINSVTEHLIEQANEPSILGSGFHILYIGRKP